MPSRWVAALFVLAALLLPAAAPVCDRYVGRFALNGTPINNVEVHSSLGGCAQRAVPFGTNSTHC